VTEVRDRLSLRCSAVLDQELVQLAVVLDRRFDVLWIDLFALLDGPGDLAGRQEVGDDVTIVAFANDGVVDCVTAHLEHLRDQAVELRQSFARRRLHVLVELLPPAFPEVLVEPGLKHSLPIFAGGRAFKPVNRAR